MAEQKRPAKAGVPALRHTLGGAPNTPHIIPGVGLVQADPPAPVGGPGEPSLDAARRAAADPGCAVELVELSADAAAVARAHYDTVRVESRRAVMAADKDLTIPADRIDDEIAAVSGQED